MCIFWREYVKPVIYNILNFGDCIYLLTVASSSLNTTCTVNYTSSVTLHCVGNNSGSWWKVTPGEDEGICTSPTCQIAGNPWLHNEDSGKYFCQVPSFIDYYVTLTVLGMTGALE